MDISHIDAMAGRAVDRANAGSLLAGLKTYAAGLDRPHRLAQFMAQILHESMGFHYDREIASGSAYEGRADLGNTQPGDGTRFKGRTSIMLTGRANYREFYDWARNRGLGPPDFESLPERVLHDPWEGLAPIWFWSKHHLNVLADVGDLTQITKVINGGTNGLADRERYYTRAALVLLFYGPTDVTAFQRAAGLAVDGVAGPKTRAALHAALRGLEPVTIKPVTTSTAPAQIAATEAPARPGVIASLLAMISRG